MRHFIDRLRVCQSGADTWCSCHALWSVTESCFGSFSTKRAATGVAPRCLFSTRGERRRKTTPETSRRITQTLQSVGLRRRCRHWLCRLGLYTSAFLKRSAIGSQSCGSQLSSNGSLPGFRAFSSSSTGFDQAQQHE